jgi:hypothetical protein
VDMQTTDLVGINGITRVLSVYTCQQGVYPRGHVLPLRLPKVKIYKTIILPVVLYVCETWSLTLRDEHRMRVFENRVLRRIFRSKRD